MSSRPFADEGEVDIKFAQILATLARIEEQTKATNGRVSSLELWRSYVLGAAAVVLLFVGLSPFWLTKFLP